MKIAFLHQENQFTHELFNQLKSKLARHELLSWSSNQSAPATDIELLIALGHVGREQLSSLDRLAFIQTASTGYESVDIDAASDLGIWVSYAPSDVTGNATSVAEFAVLLLLAASRRLGAFLQSEKDPSIDPPLIHPALSGKTVCIVGLGDIGDRIVERLRPFEMRIVATDQHPANAPEGVTAYPAEQLKAAVADADYVVICVRASKENENLIDASVLAAMKRGAILVNIARGLLIDETALLASVKTRQISAAGLDVIRDEPLKPSNPLLGFPEILVTPHIAGFTDIMLHGTAEYISQVVEEVAGGKKPKSVLNSPGKPRRDLQG